MRRWIATLTSVCMVITQSAALGGPHEEGLEAGRAANPVARDMVTAPSASTHVPQYSTTAAESVYYGKPNLGAQGNAALAVCATRPGDPVCQAQTGAVRSANTARPAISLDDPSLLQARSIARSPSGVLGSLADYYAGCNLENVDKPSSTALKTCHRRIGVGEFTLTRSLNVTVELAPSCTEGQWFARKVVDRNILDSMIVEVLCQNRSDGLVRMRFHALGQRGSCIGPQTVELPVAVADRPTFVTDLSPHWEYYCWSPFKVVMQPGSGCVDGRCNYQFAFGPPSYSCPAGSQASDTLPIGWSDSGPVYGPPARCLQVEAPPGDSSCPPDRIAIYPMGRLACAVDVGAAVLTGAEGWVVPISFTQPGYVPTETDLWDGQDYVQGGRCTPVSADRCTEGPGTRRINGRNVTRACWAYESTVTCSGASLANDCGLLARGGCTLSGSACKQTNATTGACEVFEDGYQCPVPPETVSRASNCPSNVYCLGTNCFDTSSPPDADFGRSMSMLEATREAGVYLDTDRMQVFKGEPNWCRDRLLKNCCYADSAGKGMSNQSVFGSGSKLVYDTLMNAENRAFVYQGLSALMTSGGFSGTFTSYGVTVAVNGAALPAGSSVLYAGESMVIAFDPWSLVIAIVIYIVLSMMSCNEEEGKLAMKEGAGLCHTVGTWCSSRTFGSCTEHKTGKCCFNSMLARIINEQGRSQVGKAWGTAETPDCTGFTVAQLQSLNFAAMDLSEFYASLVPTLPNVTGLQGQSNSRLPTCYFGQGRCQ
jgi:conjugal transfer mating pair stabilization protein TraN